MEGQPAGIRSKVSVKGHPLHPMGVPFPIALLVLLPFADVAYGWTDDPFWARAGWWLAGLGFLLGLLSALSGLVDFILIRRVREHVAGWIHATGNVVALLLAFWNLSLRWVDPAAAVFPWGILLSFVVAVLIGVTGWYGGELSYRHLIGVTGH